jgi:hypothetical protein
MKPTGDVPRRITEPSLLEDALRIAASLVMAFVVAVVISLHHENAEADYEAAGLESGSRE